MAKGTLYITGDVEADRLLNTEPFAALVGMLLDQQVPMEWAFNGPFTLRDRLGGRLDPTAIAAMDVDAFVAVCCEKPAIHRFPVSMGRRIHELSVVVVEHYGGDTARLWKDVTSGAEVYRRLHELPGFGDEKSKIFLAVLAKRFGVKPKGWKEAAGVFGDGEPRSVADIHDETSLAQVRSWKKTMKAAKKDKQSRPID